MMGKSFYEWSLNRQIVNAMKLVCGAQIFIRPALLVKWGSGSVWYYPTYCHLSMPVWTVWYHTPKERVWKVCELCRVCFAVGSIKGCVYTTVVAVISDLKPRAAATGVKTIATHMERDQILFLHFTCNKWHPCYISLRFHWNFRTHCHMQNKPCVYHVSEVLYLRLKL